MFTRSQLIRAGFALFISIVSLIAFAMDPDENGFGTLSLTVAPILMIAGLTGIIVALIGNELWVWTKNGLKLGSRQQHLLGLLAFGASLTLYLVTLEPTASLWDCSEFIASAYKLQIPHTPGNPLLLILGRFFSFLSLGNPERVAWSINLMSAFFAAASVWLVYSIICAIGAKLNDKNSTVSFAALIGSLILAASDTFWFSAVEAETYATSSFFILLILFLTLKGKDLDEPLRSKILILIFYIAGLAFCIHPMSVLALPLLPISWYLAHRELSFRNIVTSVVIGIGLVLFINRFVAVGIFELAFYFDLFLVNSWGLPFYSGAFLLILLLVSFFTLLITKTKINQRYSYAALLFLIGFIPYLMLFVRSNHNPPIDESNPENLALIKAYMNREGYPSRPLLFGPYFDAEVESADPGRKVFAKGEYEYEFSGNIPEYRYGSKRQTILPRLYSNDPDHISTYRSWTGLKENEAPSFYHNISFMLRYQLGHMYFRYLMFNFSGRESDIQGSSWLKPWESLSTGDPRFASKARNQYWMVPLIMGVLGAVLLYRNDRRNFITIISFFTITGLLLAIYLNSTPNEPRERDYIYVGSYIAFAILTGIGGLAILNAFESRLLQRVGMFGLAIVPAWMALQNYDDHNRAGRTLQIDNARNVLSSCEQNSILFTGGDNDTFPLWYLQEVEGFRTDVRVVVLSYLNTDWYINQLRKQYYNSPAFKLTLDRKSYRQYGPNDVIYVQEKMDDTIDAQKYLQLLNERHPALTLSNGPDEQYSILPSKNLYVRATKAFEPTGNDSVDGDNRVVLKISSNHLFKNGLAILDLLASNPDRTFHFNFGSMSQTGMNIDRYMLQKGQVFQFNPMQSPAKNIPVDVITSYNNLMKKMNYDNLLRKDFFVGYEDYEARIINPLRQSFNSLAVALLNRDDTVRASEVMTHANKYLFADHFKPSFANVQAADIMIELGQTDQAGKLALILYEFCAQQMESNGKDEINLQLMRFAAEVLNELGEPQYLNKFRTLTLP